MLCTSETRLPEHKRILHANFEVGCFTYEFSEKPLKNYRFVLQHFKTKRPNQIG